MSFLTRYEDDQSRPEVRSALRDLGMRVLLPGIVVFGIVVGLGKLIVASKAYSDAEERVVNRALAAERDSTWNTITMFWSHIGNTEYVIGVCIIVALIVWWRTKQWWYAVVPVIAISVQATIFVIATAVVGRPRPDVPKLDPAPPTSSFPSGHQGASTALYATFFLMATRIRRPWLRALVMALCALAPILVGYARMYRGMHHASDIAVGAALGITSAVLAWRWLRRRDDSAESREGTPEGGRR
ncbi:MAG: phosphatase PAP2 family protein [Dermatophilaceae bacterium]